MKKKLYIIFITISISLLSGCAYYNTFYNAKKFYNEASKQRKDRLKTQVVELSPEEREQLKREGMYSSQEQSRPSTQEMQSYQKSIEKASKVLEFFPDSKYVDDALMMLGKCFFYRREYKKAERKFQEIVELYPQSDHIPEARLFMAKTQLGLENYDLAEEQFREITLLDRIDQQIREEAAYELAGLYLEKGAYELAANEYRKTAKNSDDKLIKAMSLYRLGECLISMKLYQEAPKIFKDAVKESPNEDFKSQATFKLGEALSLIGDYDAAVKTYSDLLSKEYEKKRIPQIKLRLAENLHKKGNLNDALKWYTNIIEEHKRTDASARSYFALGEIEQFLNNNYKKAQENYELVRGEFSNSLIAPEAKIRSDNIRQLNELKNTIAELEGRQVIRDSTDAADGDSGSSEMAKEEKDDAPIDLSLDGLWVNYTGRDRPPPKSLLMAQFSGSEETASIDDQQLAAADSTLDEAALAQKAVEDSLTRAQRAEEEKARKKILIDEKRLAMAELFLFSFELPDSSIELYIQVIENQTDSVLIAKALYSLGYIYKDVKKDTVIADSIYRNLILLYPDSPQADGARKILDIQLESTRLDSAQQLFKNAEYMYLQRHNYQKAVDQYKAVITKFPDSEFALQSKFAIGWIYENDVYDYDKARDTYEEIVKEHPDSPFAKGVKPKLMAIEQAQKEEEARQKALADSLQKIKEASQDSSVHVAMDSVAVDSLGNPVIPDSLSANGNQKNTAADSLLQNITDDSVANESDSKSEARSKDEQTTGRGGNSQRGVNEPALAPNDSSGQQRQLQEPQPLEKTNPETQDDEEPEIIEQKGDSTSKSQEMKK